MNPRIPRPLPLPTPVLILSALAALPAKSALITLTLAQLPLLMRSQNLTLPLPLPCPVFPLLAEWLAAESLLAPHLRSIPLATYLTLSAPLSATLILNPGPLPPASSLIPQPPALGTCTPLSLAPAQSQTLNPALSLIPYPTRHLPPFSPSIPPPLVITPKGSLPSPPASMASRQHC